MSATPRRSPSESETSGLGRLAPANAGNAPVLDRSIELVEPVPGPNRTDDALAVVVAGAVAVSGVFISWVLLAPGALDVLK